MRIKFIIDCDKEGEGVPFALFAKAGNIFQKLLSGVAADSRHPCEFCAYVSDGSHPGLPSIFFVEKRGNSDAVRAVAESVKRYSESLGTGNCRSIPGGVLKELSKLEKLCKNGRHGKIRGMEAQVHNGKFRETILSIDANSLTIENFRKEEIVVPTSIVGRVGMLNLRNKKGLIRLYSRWDKKSPVEIFFSEKFKGRVIKSLEKLIEVRGEGRFRPGRVLPYRMEMSSIKTLPDKIDWAGWRAMRGAFPDITGGLSIDEYVAKIRRRGEDISLEECVAEVMRDLEKR